jgi:tripartite-type tricarboxylate transporter receptor subunit TctC
MAPAGTPKDVVARLNAEVRKALSDPELRTKFDAQGLTLRGSSADELGVATRDKLAKYARLIKQAGITSD